MDFIDLVVHIFTSEKRDSSIWSGSGETPRAWPSRGGEPPGRGRARLAPLALPRNAGDRRARPHRRPTPARMSVRPHSGDPGQRGRADQEVPGARQPPGGSSSSVSSSARPERESRSRPPDPFGRPRALESVRGDPVRQPPGRAHRIRAVRAEKGPFTAPSPEDRPVRGGGRGHRPDGRVCDLPPPLQGSPARAPGEELRAAGRGKAIEWTCVSWQRASPIGTWWRRRVPRRPVLQDQRRDLAPPTAAKPAEDNPPAAARFLRKPAGARHHRPALLRRALEVMTRHEVRATSGVRTSASAAALRAAGQGSVHRRPAARLHEDRAGNSFARAASRGDVLEEVEAAYIREVLQPLKRNRSAAARVLEDQPEDAARELRRHGAGRVRTPM